MKRSFNKFANVVKISDLYGDDPEEFLDKSTDVNRYYVLSDEHGDDAIGTVLLLNSELRDGLIIVYVDDCGHTQVIDKKNYKKNDDLYIGQLSDDHSQILKIMHEFDHDHYGPYYEIHRLRKLLGNNDASK